MRGASTTDGFFLGRALCLATLGSCLVACESAPPSSPPGGPGNVAAAAVADPSLGPATSAAEPATAFQVSAAEELLDLDGRGTLLLGVVDPVPFRADPLRTLRARLVRGERELPWFFADRPLIDARFVADGSAVLVLDGRRRLMRVDCAREPAERRLAGCAAASGPLDEQVEGPLAVSAGGRHVVYLRGEMPLFDVVRLDLETGATELLAAELPVWSPAVSPDGSAVLLTASMTGRPELWRLGPGEPLPVQVTRTASDDHARPFPNGPSAPIWVDDLLWFEDPAGLHLMRPDGSLIARHADLRSARLLPGSAVVARSRTAPGRFVPVAPRAARGVAP